MLLHHAYAALLLFLLSFILFQPCQQSPTNQRVSLKGLNNALVSNVRQFFADTKKSRDFGVMQKREGMLQVLLNNHGMQQINRNEVSNSVIARHLSVPRKTVAKHRDNKIPFRKTHPSKKKPGLTKNAFIFQHNQLCQTMVKFWLDHSVPSPNKKDVKWKHSGKQGDHVRAYNEDKSSYTIKCTTGKCTKDQRRCVVEGCV